MALFGLCRADDTEDGDPPGPAADPQAPACHLWRCNVVVWNIWLQVQTQWRVSAVMDSERKTGLDYGGVAVYLFDVLGVPRSKKGRPCKWRGTDLADIWLGLQAMEVAALNAWTELRNERPAG